MMRSASGTWPDRGWGHSPDGRWWWDGTAWVRAFSPDGAHWWDGSHWLRVPAEPSGARKSLILIGWVFTILVLLFDAVAALVGTDRAFGHDISGSSIIVGPFCAFITPVVVFLTWWSDSRPLRPRLLKIKRLVVVGLLVGVPFGFVAYQMVSFKY